MNVEDLYRILRTGHIQAQGIVDTINDPMIVLDESLCVQAVSRSFLETFKVERYEAVGQHIYELGNGQWDIPELRRLLLEVIPKATAVIDYEVAHDFPRLGRRTMLVTARTLFHPDNASHSMLLVIADQTDRMRRDAAKDMLAGELRHRIKNLLALARAIARQTATDGRSAEEYRDTFLGRFGALVEAQELAFAEQEEIRLGDLAARILAPYAGNPQAVVIEDGAPAALAPRMITALGLVLHELATNAAKYGALSVPAGQVRIAWENGDADGTIRVTWVESGGPPVSPPAATGYGTHVIRNATTYSLGGDVKLDYAAEGLKAEIVVPTGKAALPD